MAKGIRIINYNIGDLISNRDWWHTFCLVGLIGVTLYVGLSQHPSSFDDAYITYRYARNIALNRGFVYNVGEPVLGTTTPLYALILAGGSLIGLDIPTFSHIIGVLAWSLCVLVTYGIGQAGEQSSYVGLIAASLVALNALFLDVLGMETLLYILLSLSTFLFLIKEKLTWAALCAGLTFFTRWDGILVVGILLLVVFLKRDKHLVKVSTVCACIVVPWLMYSYITFGSIFPNSFFAKAGQGWKEGLGAEEIGPFVRGIGMIARSAYKKNQMFLFLPFFSVVGGLSAFRDRVKWWPLILWTASYFGGYTVLGVLQFSWYYPPLIPVLILLTAKGIEFVAEHPFNRREWIRPILLVILLALCLIPNLDWLTSKQKTKMGAHTATYVEVGEWLRDHTPQDSSVVTIEIGVIGFYSDRTIVDTMGLVSPGMLGHLEGWSQTLRFAVNHYWPDYAVVLKKTAWSGLIREPWFKEAYALDTRIENPRDPVAPVSIYHRRSGFPVKEFALTSLKNVSLDQVLNLKKIRVAEEKIDVDNKLHVQLIWEALANVNKNYLIKFDLVDASNGERITLSSNLQPMRGGNPTYQWDKGDYVIDNYTLETPSNLPSGRYLLQLIVTHRNGRAVMIDMDDNPLEYLVVGPIPTTNLLISYEVPKCSVNATFADNIMLNGYDLQYEDDELTVTLHWKAAEKVSRDYTIFVHLLSPKGDLIAQHDSPPRLPSRLWIPGIQVIDSHVLSLPAKESIDDYQIRVGLYHWPELERVPVLDSNQFEVSNNALLLQHISSDDLSTPVSPVYSWGYCQRAEIQ